MTVTNEKCLNSNYFKQSSSSISISVWQPLPLGTGRSQVRGPAGIVVGRFSIRTNGSGLFLQAHIVIYRSDIHKKKVA